MKSRLGQNFLTSKTIAQRIADAADIQPDDTILEIGPGKGILTEAILAKNPKKLIAVEKDVKFIPQLAEKFPANKNLEIINSDILKILDTRYKIPDTKYKIAANIPYYITSHLLRLIFSQKNLPERVVLMVQKEVAERICARPPRMNLLALSVQAYGRPKIAFRVPKTFFRPRPKVDSAVIVIDNISRDFFASFGVTSDVEEESRDKSRDNGKTSDVEIAFFKLLHAGFRQKRKFLLSNLKNSIPGMAGGVWINAFEICGLNEKTRAENLSLKDWKCLSGFCSVNLIM